VSYHTTDFEYWKHEGDVSEDLFVPLMASYGKRIIRHPFGVKQIDYGAIDLSEFYEVRQLGKEVPGWLIQKLGIHYPMVMDVGKCYKATAFYNAYKERPQYVFLRLHYAGDWKHLNGWWTIPMYKFLNRFWKDQNAGVGNYTRQMRTDEQKTGRVNVCKWHIPLGLWKKIAEGDGSIIRGYDETGRCTGR